MSFQITKPGFYRQRNGGKAEVVAVSRELAIGFRHGVNGPNDGGVDDWYVNGSFMRSRRESVFDLVSVWCEPPFRISDHGCGVYETRGGRMAHVTVLGKPSDKRWQAKWPDTSCWWPDDGRCFVDKEVAYDLVRYIGPLPEPQPEWVATNRWRNRVLNRDAGGTLPDGTISCVVDGAWKFVVPEQLWTCGDREDWRTAEVQR